MPLSFSTDPDDPINPDYVVEDASDEEEQVDFEEAFSGAEDEMKEEESVVSASDFEDTGDLPDRLLFGELECRAIFTQKSDGGKFHRVCGCRASECTREGHSALRLSLKGRAPEGTYEPVRARKYVDGRFETHLPKEEFFAQMESLQKERRAGVTAAAASLGTSQGEPGEYKLRMREEDSKRSPTGVLKSGRPKHPTTPGFYDMKAAAKIQKKAVPTSFKTAPEPVPPIFGRVVPEPVPLTPEDQQDMIARMMSEFGNEMMKKMRLEFGQADKTKATGGGKQSSKGVGFVAGQTVQLTKHWYAVINGKGGVNSVFSEWIGGAAPYVTGVSGALSKKFSDFNEAWAHVEAHLATVQRLKDEEDAKNRAATKARVLPAIPNLPVIPLKSFP
jgi:hypothetical protein